MDLSKMRETSKELQNPQKTPKEFAVSKEIKAEVNNIFRIVDSEKYSKCQRSWIICDDGKSRPFTLVDNFGNASPFLKLLGDHNNFYRNGILESVKDPITKKGTPKYATEYPELVNRFYYNGDRASSKGSAKLQKQVVFQIIDRDLYEGVDEHGATIKYYWCKENKHTMLIWLKVTAFETLIDVAEGNGDLVDYDCTYKKVGAGMSTTHVISRCGDKIPGVVIGPITDEEKSYTMYDLDSETAVAPAGLILYFLEKAIKDLDVALGMNVYDELKTVAALERSEQPDAEEVNASTAYEAEEEDSESATPPVAQAQKAPFVRGAAVTPPVVDPNVPMITCKHEGCNKQIPADSITCPECRNVVKAPCDNPDCAKLFSVWSTTCPHCGKIYQ